jgi:hypothetical protein
VEKEVNGVREVGRLEGEVGGSQKKLGSGVGPKKTLLKKKTVTERKKM